MKPSIYFCTGRAGGKVLKSPYRSPNLNAYVERVIQTLRASKRSITSFSLARSIWTTSSRPSPGFFNERRPPQSKDNLTLPIAAEFKPDNSLKLEVVEALPLSQVRCEAQLGGLLKHYYRQAA